MKEIIFSCSRIWNHLSLVSNNPFLKTTWYSRWSTVFQYLTYDPDFFFWPQDMTLGCVYPFTGLVRAHLVNLHLKFTSAKTPCSASLFSPTYLFLILSQISMRTFLSIILMFLFLFCLVTTCYHTAFATWLHVTSYVLIIKVLAKYP